jgi:hypothetical protein
VLLDALENVALLKMLRGGVKKPWLQIARWCALPKFAPVIAGLLYSVVGCVGLFS